jgi:outer membrane protein assembly factor BamB
MIRPQWLQNCRAGVVRDAVPRLCFRSSGERSDLQKVGGSLARRNAPRRTRVAFVTLMAVFSLAIAVAQDGTLESETVGALTDSAAVDRSREAEAKLKQAIAHADAGEIASCLQLLDQVLAEEALRFVRADELGLEPVTSDSFGELSLTTRQAVRRLLERLPEAVRRQFRAQSSTAAQRQLDVAISDDGMQQLREIVLRFPKTDQSLDALRRIAVSHLDHGRLREAAATFRQVIQHPLSTEPIIDHARSCLRFLATGASDSSADGAERSEPGRSEPGRLEATTAAGSRASSSVARLAGPSDWHIETSVDADTQTLLDEAMREHQEQAIPVLPQFKPQISNEVLFVRSQTRLGAYRIATGEPLWLIQPEAGAIHSQTRPAMNLSLHDLVGRMVARQLQLDTVYSTLQVDDRFLYAVEAAVSDDSELNPRQPLSPFAAATTSPLRNRIVARHQQTGTEVWSFAASGVLKGDETDAFFVGPPVVIDESAFGVVQIEDRIELYELDRLTGRLLHRVLIGRTPRRSAADTDWRTVACPMTEADGILVCPTAAGLVVGFDLVTRTPVWARRYFRDDAPPLTPRLPGANNKQLRHWWHGWRETSVAIVAPQNVAPQNVAPQNVAPQNVAPQNVASQNDDTRFNTAAKETSARETLAVVTSPDSLSVFALNVVSGDVRWRLPVENPLFVESAPGNQFLIVERHLISSVDAATGDVMWSTPIGEPVGRGFLASHTGSLRLTIPVRGGRLAIVRLSDGQIDASVRFDAPSGVVLRNAREVVVAQTLDRVAVWRSIGSKTPAALDPARQPQPDESVGELPDTDDVSRQNRQRREQLQKIIDLAEQAPSTTLFQTMKAEIENGQLAIEVGEKRSLLHSTARVAMIVGDSVEAATLYLKLLASNPVGDESVFDDGPLRVVRRDRLMQAELLDLIQKSSRGSDTAPHIARLLQEANEAARSSRDPFAVQRFATRTRALPSSGEVALLEEARIGQSFVESQIDLLRLIDHPIKTVADAAAKRLAELFEARRYERDAAAVRHRLIQTQQIPTRPGENGSDDRAVDSARLLETLRSSDWPVGRPTTSNRSENQQDTSFRPVPIECQQGSLFERLDVALQMRSPRDSPRLRFYGDGNAGYWELPLPKSSSPFRPVWSLPRAWGVGHLLVLRVGAELFGISPYSNNGEPRARLLWSVDMAEGTRFHGHRYQSPVPGFVEDDLILLDAYDRPIAQVGPVLPGYLCFQTKGQLVCLDTLTGQRLWQRSELPQSPHCSGDERFVFLVEHDSWNVTVLSAIDGRTIRRSSPLAPDSGLSSGGASNGGASNGGASNGGASNGGASNGGASNGGASISTSGPAGVGEDGDALKDETVSRQKLLRLTGRLALFGLLDESRINEITPFGRLLQIDLSTGLIAQVIEVPEQTVAFALDEDQVGLLSQHGELKVLSLRTGEPLQTLQVDRPEHIHNIRCQSGSGLHVIAMSEDIEQPLQQGGQFSNDFRNPPLNGSLLAIDRFSGEKIWQRPVRNVRLALEQPGSVPLLLMSFLETQFDGDVPKTQSVLYILDRRTGEDVLYRKGAQADAQFAIDPNLPQNRVELRFPRGSVRLSFDVTR